MFPLLGDDDRENMTRIWQMVMPAEVFGGAIQLVHQAIGDDFAELTRRIPTGRMTAGPARARGNGQGRPPGAPEPLIRSATTSRTSTPAPARSPRSATPTSSGPATC